MYYHYYYDYDYDDYHYYYYDLYYYYYYYYYDYYDYYYYYIVAKLCSSSFAFCIAHSLNQFPLTMNNPRFLPHFTFSVLSALARTCVTLSFIAVAMVAPSPRLRVKAGVDLVFRRSTA